MKGHIVCYHYSETLARRTALAALLLILMSTFSPTRTLAMELKIVGDQIILSGPVVGDEPGKVREALASSPGIDTVILRNSPGGDAPSGYQVGALLRERSLRTAVSGYCYSSCSRMFLGGSTRYFTGDYLPENNNVGFHGHYDRMGHLDADRVRQYGLRDWIIKYSDGKADFSLIERWINIPYSRGMIHFFHPGLVKRTGASTFMCQVTSLRVRSLPASRLLRQRSISASSHHWTLCTAPIADSPKVALSIRSCTLPRSSRNSPVAAKRFIAEGRSPVPGDDELGTIQKLNAIQGPPARSAPSSTVLKRFAPSRRAPDRFTPFKFVPRRSARRSVIFHLQVEAVIRQHLVNLVGRKHANGCFRRKVGHPGERRSQPIQIRHAAILLRNPQTHDIAGVALAPLRSGPAGDVQRRPIPRRGGNAGHLEMVESAISTRPLEVISN